MITEILLPDVDVEMVSMAERYQDLEREYATKKDLLYRVIGFHESLVQSGNLPLHDTLTPPLTKSEQFLIHPDNILDSYDSHGMEFLHDIIRRSSVENIDMLLQNQDRVDINNPSYLEEREEVAFYEKVCEIFDFINKGWGIYGISELRNYDVEFEGILEGLTLQEYIRTKYPNGIYMVDLMGPGGILRKLIPLKGGCAVSLGDGRSQFEREFDENNNIDFIEANLLKESDWQKVLEKLRGKADFLILRPLMGWDEMPSSVDYYTELFINTISILNNEGTALIKLPFSSESSNMEIVLDIVKGKLSEEGKEVLINFDTIRSAFSVKLISNNQADKV